MNQANQELDKIMPQFMGKFDIALNIFEKNSKDNPTGYTKELDLFMRNLIDEWLDMALIWPLIHSRQPELFYDINHMLLGEQPPMSVVKESCKKAVESKGE